MFDWMKRILDNSPTLRVVARRAYDFVATDVPWLRAKPRILRDARASFAHDASLDVSMRYGTHVFHNRGNSLVKRGREFEPELQHALLVLIGLDRLRNRDTVFADVGANIGLHTFFVRSRYPDVPIVAFDPSPSSWRYLEFSLAYGRIPGVRLEKIALSDTDGTLELYNWGEESSADSLRDTQRVQGISPNIIQVAAARLDDLAVASNISVIKMDCEGAECSILRGAVNTLRRNRPFMVLEFYEPNFRAFGVTADSIFRLLDEIEYDMLTLDLEKLDVEEFQRLQARRVDSYILLPRKLFEGGAAPRPARPE